MKNESCKIPVARLYNDKSGESHFIDEMLELTAANFAPPAPPIYVSAGMRALQAVYLFLPAGWVGDFHPAPRRQIMTLISGSFESSASNGETRRFSPGNTMLVEDTEGKGHSTRILEDCTIIVSQLA